MNIGVPSSTTSEVAKHIDMDQPEHTVELDNTEILTTEPRKEVMRYQST